MTETAQFTYGDIQAHAFVPIDALTFTTLTESPSVPDFCATSALLQRKPVPSLTNLQRTTHHHAHTSREMAFVGTMKLVFIHMSRLQMMRLSVSPFRRKVGATRVLLAKNGMHGNVESIARRVFAVAVQSVVWLTS